MAVELNFCIESEDMDRLWQLKKEHGKNELTGNQFAQQLFVEMLRQECPKVDSRKEE